MTYPLHRLSLLLQAHLGVLLSDWDSLETFTLHHDLTEKTWPRRIGEYVPVLDDMYSACKRSITCHFRQEFHTANIVGRDTSFSGRRPEHTCTKSILRLGETPPTKKTGRKDPHSRLP